MRHFIPLLSTVPYRPPLDGIANLYAAYGAAKPVSSYSGPLYNARRGSDSATMDVYATHTGWPSLGALQSWLSGTTGYVTKVYSQDGTGARDISPASTAAQPTLNLNGQYPVFEFDGATQEIAATTQLSAFTQNSAGVSIIASRQFNIATTGVDRLVCFFGTATSTTRLSVGQMNATSKESVSGRRLDADTISRSTGFTNNTSWATQIVRADWANAKLYHQRDASSEIVNPFQTAGSSQNTASGLVGIGSAGNGTAFFNGKMSMIALVSRVLTDAETAALI